MRRWSCALAASVWMVAAASSVPQAAPQAEPQGTRPRAGTATSAAGADNPALIAQYCVTCHSDRLKTQGLTLQSIDFSNVGAHADVLEKATRKIKVGMMPPQGAPQPDPATRQALVAWLETSLDKAAAANPHPGRALIHRLNRAEYANAVRDLLTLDVDAAALLPPDDSAYGFDNIADALGLSPSLQERYLSVASRISELAVGDPGLKAAGVTFRVRQD